MKEVSNKINNLTLVNNILTKMVCNIKIFKGLQTLSGCCVFNSLVINRLRGCKKNVKFMLHNSLKISTYFYLVRILSGCYGNMDYKLWTTWLFTHHSALITYHFFPPLSFLFLIFTFAYITVEELSRSCLFNALIINHLQIHFFYVKNRTCK